MFYEVSGESLFFSGGYTQRWKALTHDGDAVPLVGLLAGQQVQVDPANPSGVDPQDPGNTATGSTGTGSTGTGSTGTGTVTGTISSHEHQIFNPRVCNTEVKHVLKFIF